jgi:membrane protein
MADINDTSERAEAPPPDDRRKPDAPTDLKKRTWMHVLRSTMAQFSRDQCTDLAAALTYYAVLAAAPALLALVSVLGLVSNGGQAVERVIGTMDGVLPPDVLSVVEPLIQNAAGGGGKAGFALILGVALALWSASGYVGAFGRAMNRIYEIDEGRPIWKLRPVMLLVTLVAVIIAAVIVAALALSGPVAQAVGDAIGLGSTAVTVWNIAKWPVVLLLVVVLVAILYHVTPNVRQPKMRWLSVGAFVAILVWILASTSRPSRTTTPRTGRWPASSCSSCGCGSPTSRCCSAPSWTRSWSGAGSSRAASPPRRRCSCRRRTRGRARSARRSAARRSSAAGSCAWRPSGPARAGTTTIVAATTIVTATPTVTPKPIGTASGRTTGAPAAGRTARTSATRVPPGAPTATPTATPITEPERTL